MASHLGQIHFDEQTCLLHEVDGCRRPTPLALYLIIVSNYAEVVKRCPGDIARFTVLPNSVILYPKLTTGLARSLPTRTILC